ncbi:hypothetical protein Peur_042253 [Populus x canadensis]
MWTNWRQCVQRQCCIWSLFVVCSGISKVSPRHSVKDKPEILASLLLWYMWDFVSNFMMHLQRRQSKKEFSTASSSSKVTNCFLYNGLNITRNCVIAKHKYIGTEHLCEHKYVVSKPFVSCLLAGCYMGNCLVWNPNGYSQVGST